MGLGDYDMMGRKIKTPAQKRRAALTPALKENFKLIVGNKCEKCGAKRKLQIDHIKRVADGGTNTASNLVAVCGSCHDEKLTQVEMKKAIAKRSATQKSKLTALLKTRKKVDKKKPSGPLGVSSDIFGGNNKRGRKKKDDWFGRTI